MKTLVIIALSALSLLGCNGSVTIYENPASLENNGWTTATPSTSTATTSTTTESTTETATEPPVEVIELVVTQQPIDGDLTGAIEHLMEFDLYAPNHELVIESLSFTILSTDGSGLVKGMNGKSFFQFNQVTNVVDGSLYAGPLELDAPNGAMFADVVLTDSFVIAKGETLKQAFASALSWIKPDDIEFAGHDFQIVFNLDEIVGVVVESGASLTPGNVSPEEDLKQSFHIPKE